MAFECVLNEKSAKLKDFSNDKNTTFANIGAFENLSEYISDIPDAKLSSPGKLFLKDLLNLSSCEISFAKMLAGEKSPFKHIHTNNEEIYIVLSGNGKLTVDDKVYDLKEGSVAKVAPDGIRTIEATTSDLVFMCVQAKKDSLDGYTLTDGKVVG